MKAPNVIGAPSIVELPGRTTVGQRWSTPFEGMFATVTPVLKQIRRWALEHPEADMGPFYLRYYHCDMKALMDIETGVFVRPGTTAEPPWVVATTPAGRFATLVYRGNGLRGNQALLTWIKDRGLVPVTPTPQVAETYACRYEAYLTDYRLESRKLLWDIELSIQIQD